MVGTKRPTRIRAVVLVTLVVAATVVGSLAFAGAAVATAGNVSVTTDEPVAVDETVELELDTTDTETYYVGLDANEDDAIQSGEVVATHDGAGGAGETVTFTPSDADGFDAGSTATYTIAILGSIPDGNGDGTPEAETVETTSLDVDGQVDAVAINTAEGQYARPGDDVSLDVDAADPNFEAATLALLDGETTVGTAAIESGGTGLTETLPVPAGTDEGTYAVELTVEDAAGNTESVTETDLVTVDATAPTIENFDAAFDNAADEMTVTVEADEELAPDSIEVGLANPPEGADEVDPMTGFTATSGEYEYEFTGTVEGNVERDLTFTLDAATDLAGNDGASGETADVYVDTRAPRVEDVTVTGGENFDAIGDNEAFTDDDDLTVSATVVDTSAVTSIEADLDSIPGLAGETADLTRGDGDTYTTTVDAADTSLDDETIHDVPIVATDAAGNENDTEVGRFYEDARAPTLSGVTLTDGKTTLELALSDGYAGIDMDTVESADFAVSDGSIEDVTVASNNQYDSGATVTLDLGEPVDAASLDVSLAEDESIADKLGNERTDATVTVDRADGVPPTLANATVTNDAKTELAVDLVDGGAGLDPGSIDSQAFSLSAGTVDSVDVSSITPAQQNATVTFTLANPVDVDSIDVSLAADWTIFDMQGNELDESAEAVTAEDADGVAPDVETNAETNGNEVTLTITSSEELDVIESSVSTNPLPTEEESPGTSFDRESFDSTETADGVEYTVTYETPRDGQYRFYVSDLIDPAGNVNDYQHHVYAPTVDYTTPAVVDAYIVGTEPTHNSPGYDTVVRTNFDGPIDAEEIDSASIDVENGSVADTNVDEDWGYIDVFVSGAYQTGDEPTVAFEASEAVGESETTVHTMQLELYEGTNFVSVPAETGSLDLTSLDQDEFDLGDVETIWTYEDGQWLNFDPDAGENDFSTLEGGQGYVVEMANKSTMTVNVDNAIGERTPGQQHLSEGWNLVGHYQEGVQDAGTGFASIDDNLFRVLAQDGPGYEYVEFSDPRWEVYPGESYWVFVTDDEVYTATPLGEYVGESTSETTPTETE